MDYLIHKLLDSDQALQIAQKLLSNDSIWQDGKLTAGSHAAKVKNNSQLNRESELSISLAEEVANKIRNNDLLKSFSLPRHIHGIMFTKSIAGQGYGEHIDNAYMSTGRSDLSFTLFLNKSENYGGGELSIQTMQEVKKVKLDPGQIIIYPSTSIHSVETVTGGERIVCVGWIESYITSNEDRELLFGLDAGARGLLATHGRSHELDLVFQAYSNLLRRLGK